MDFCPPGSSVHGISQERILEWVTTSFSRGSSWSRGWTQVSCISGFFTTEPPGKFQTNWCTCCRTFFRLYILGYILLIITVFKGFFFKITLQIIEITLILKDPPLWNHSWYIHATISYFIKILFHFTSFMAKQTHCIMDFSTLFSPFILDLRLQTRGFLKTVCFILILKSISAHPNCCMTMRYTELNHCFFYLIHQKSRFVKKSKECFLFCNSF